MDITELKGTAIKAELSRNRIPIVRAIKRYHNKNKSGGNFGFTIVINPLSQANPLQAEGEEWFNLSGYYNTAGLVYGLGFGRFSGAGVKVRTDDFKELIQTISEEIRKEIKEKAEAR